MLGDQGGIFIACQRVTRFDGGRDAPMQLGAIRFELAFVGDRADRRMVKDVLRSRSEVNLIDELSA
jgi:hypothetical protein